MGVIDCPPQPMLPMAPIPDDPCRHWVVGEAYAPGAEVTRERDRLCLVNVPGASMIADLDTERELRVRLVFLWDCRPATGEGDGVGVTAGPISEVALRPRPSALAVLERCSE